jgi:hypothetical protein
MPIIPFWGEKLAPIEHQAGWKAYRPEAAIAAVDIVRASDAAPAWTLDLVATGDATPVVWDRLGVCHSRRQGQGSTLSHEVFMWDVISGHDFEGHDLRDGCRNGIVTAALV